MLLMAHRNLWRNRRRTLITMAAITLNTALLIATYALMDGLLDQTTRNATQLVTGEAELHAPGYLVDRSLYKVLDRPDDILRQLQEKSIGAAPRVYGYGLVSRGTKSAGALFWGIDPELERASFDLVQHVWKGEFLASPARKGMVLGKKLARSLDAQLGSEIVVVVQAADGSLGNELYTVTGILGAAGDSVDRSAAMLHLDDFRSLFAMPEGIHEIAVNTRRNLSVNDLTVVLSSIAPTAEVRTWRELLPMLWDMIQMSDASMAVFGAVFVLAAGLGVLNTMLMATYERIHEFGIIKALGATPWRIVRDVTVEAWLLAFLSTFLGGVVGVAVSCVLQQVGLDTSGFAGEYSIGGVAFDPVWRSALSVGAVIKPVIAMWLTCVAAALYPAVISARLDPVKSISHV